MKGLKRFIVTPAVYPHAFHYKLEF